MSAGPTGPTGPTGPDESAGRWPQRRADLWRGALEMAPMLVGVVPFGVIAGASPVNGGLGAGVAVGFSTIVFAGASQLTAIGILTTGGSAVSAILAACAINLRMMLYGASLAPFLAHEPLRRRVLSAYWLTDEAYALAVARWNRDPGRLEGVDGPDRRVWFYLGAASSLWVVWQVSTVVGAVVGDLLPERVPLDVAVPLVFLVLLIPTLISRAAWVAAGVGGGVAVAAAQAGAPRVATLVGAVAGIVAGALVDRDGLSGGEG